MIGTTNIEDMDFFDVPRYKGRLKISKNGQLLSLLTNKILKPHIMPNGYVAYCIMFQKPKRHTKTEYLHRLLAETFIPNPEKKETVNHIDGDKSNNTLENLEWATQSENNLHAIKMGLRNPNCSGFTRYNLSKRVLSDDEIMFIKKHKDMTTRQLSILLNNNHLYAIDDVRRGVTWRDMSNG